MPKAMRKVVSSTLTPQGSILMLDCGHGVWRGGFRIPNPVGMSIRCLTYPCYRPDRYFGD